MKIAAIALGILLIASCNNHGDTAKSTDSVTINTTETNKADGGPNNGLGDTNAHNQVKDTTAPDTLNKK
jgi:hypothetical protein